jgi:putative hydrolase of the HAD superfamily
VRDAHGLLLILPERDDAEALAAELGRVGWAPCDLHRERLAGDDDPEAVEWVLTLATAPDGSPAGGHRAELEELADSRDGFVTAWDD